MRCEYQVIVIPFIKESPGTKFLVMKRTDDENWQFISGGGENSEAPIDAAKREAIEEANIETSNEFYALDTIASIPKYHFREHRNKKDIYVIPEYSFAVRLNNYRIKLSGEHTDHKWASYEEALSLLKYDSNKTALWELMSRLEDNQLTKL